MNIEITKKQFVDLIEQTEYKYGFTRDGIELMFDYYELADRDIRFNAKEITERFNQYKNKKEIVDAFDDLKMEDVDGFIDFMGVVRLDNGDYFMHNRGF